MWTLIQTVDTNHPPKYVPRQRVDFQSQINGIQSAAMIGYGGENREGVGMMSYETTPSDRRAPNHAWGVTSNCSVPDYGSFETDHKENGTESYTPEYETLTGNKVNMYPSLYKITQHDFRRLTDQVKELPPNGKFKGQGFKRFYTGGNGESVPVVYRSQLAASTRAFQHTKERPPYDNKWKDDPPTRCRPVCPHGPEKLSARGPTPPTPRTPQPPTHARSRSSPRHPTSTRPLPPGIRSRSRSASPSNSIERSLSPSSTVSLTSSKSITVSSAKGTSREATKEVASRRTLRNSQKISKEATSTNSDLRINIPESARTPDPFDTLTPSASYLLSGSRPYSVYGDKRYMESEDDSSDLMSVKEEDQDSEEEGPEPNLDTIDVNALPELQLRPEKIDGIYTPEYARGDRRKYDFDALNIIQPAYTFCPALSEEMMEENLTALSQEDSNWRENVKNIPEDDLECDMIDRLIEFERLQSKTHEYEQARKERLTKQARIREAKAKAGSTIRHQSAKLRERKCCSDCMQLLCIGNCAERGPGKANLCKICHEDHPTLNCTEAIYTGRMRSERVSLEDEKPKPPPPQRPKSCQSCQRLHNAKTINANSVALGRPKSCNLTFSRGQDSKRRSLNQFTATQIPPEVERDLIKLGIDPVTMKVEPKPVVVDEKPKRPHTACETTTRGRAGISPGKSYFSQLRSSITDLAKATKRAKSAGPRRKTGRKKRPQTAC